MDRGAWQATVHGVARVGHDLTTKPPPHIELIQFIEYFIIRLFNLFIYMLMGI